ncbi:N-acetylmuramoyl-L-alanine amidase AmiB [Candidatus Profftia lariciata]|nr:N-acetylmuramoyl-L-alanine amidase AmiB [Candidatus Profftia lariciata]
MSISIYTVKFLVIVCFFLSNVVYATQLINIKVLNKKHKAQIILIFNRQPTYTYFLQPNLHRVLINIISNTKIKTKLPIKFNDNNILRCIHTSTRPKTHSIQIIFDVTHKINMSISHHRRLVVLTLKKYVSVIILKKPLLNKSIVSIRCNWKHNIIKAHNKIKIIKHIHKLNSRIIKKKKIIVTPVSNYQRAQYNKNNKIIVAIDAGHGGQDPGAIGSHGLCEKNVTLAIAKKLQKIMDNDQIFHPVLTRNGDYFISVIGRSNQARKQQANLLISIHSDAAPNHSAAGSSIWLLSKRRANNEMSNWLEKHEKQSELLGGVSNVLANNQHDKYFSQAILDLQFDHAQHVGSGVAVQVIRQMQTIGHIHKLRPEYASLGVLSSPDIPSLLIETGFISNKGEEHLLGDAAYQEKIAKAIYKGVRNYFIMHL